MKNKKPERRGARGIPAGGAESDTQVKKAGEWPNGCFNGARDGKLRVPDEAEEE